MKKGSGIYVEGRIQTRSWEGATDNKKNYRTEIIADRVQFGPKRDSSIPSTVSVGKNDKEVVPPEGTIDYPEESVNIDDIPF
jgi:single-strand DNA-binding protein